MKQSERYCECQRRALVPPSRVARCMRQDAKEVERRGKGRPALHDLVPRQLLEFRELGISGAARRHAEVSIRLKNRSIKFLSL